MNLFIVTGRVATTPEMRQTDKGRLYLRYRFAIEGNWRKDIKSKDVDFISVTAYNKLAQNQYKLLRKGVRLMMYGMIHTFEVEDSTGMKHERAVFIPSKMEIIDIRVPEDPVTDLRGSDGKVLIPRELSDSFNKLVDSFNDPDMPEDVIREMGR